MENLRYYDIKKPTNIQSKIPISLTVYEYTFKMIRKTLLSADNSPYIPKAVIYIYTYNFNN